MFLLIQTRSLIGILIQNLKQIHLGMLTLLLILKSSLSGILRLTLSLILIQTHLLTQTLKPRPTLKYSLIEILKRSLTPIHSRM